MAAEIGEVDEAERCEQFLLQLDPSGAPGDGDGSVPVGVKPTGVVLTGGGSRRMGVDKALVEVDGVAMASRVAEGARRRRMRAGRLPGR